MVATAKSVYVISEKLDWIKVKVDVTTKNIRSRYGIHKGGCNFGRGRQVFGRFVAIA